MAKRGLPTGRFQDALDYDDFNRLPAAIKAQYQRVREIPDGGGPARVSYKRKQQQQAADTDPDQSADQDQSGGQQ